MRRSANAPEPEHLRAVLGRCELLGGLGEAERAAVADALEWCYVPGGERVFGPGDPSDALYVVVHGRLRVYWDLDGSGRIDPQEQVDEVAEGGVVGDVGMLSDDPHTSLALAVRDSELGRLPEAKFWALAERYPSLTRRIGRHAVRRLQAVLHPSPPPERVNVAVVPADASAPAAALVRALAEALDAMHPALAVDPESFDRALGPGASTDDVDRWDELDRRVVRWICDQERRHRYILYRTDPRWTAWTRRCLRMADRLVVVADALADPTPGEVEVKVAGPGGALVPLDLVLVHPDDRALPSGTERWIRARAGVEQVHHVRLGDPEAVRRLARLVAGRGVGLVLGGGG
ncbi:MAG: cyclic nucleotide-binding domain-containing protein, partial [Myxococcota bacterium]